MRYRILGFRAKGIGHWAMERKLDVPHGYENCYSILVCWRSVCCLNVLNWNLGNVYQSLGNYTKAIDYHQQSLAIALAPDDMGELNDGLLTANEIFDQIFPKKIGAQYLRSYRFVGKRKGLTVATLAPPGNCLTLFLLNWRFIVTQTLHVRKDSRFGNLPLKTAQC